MARVNISKLLKSGALLTVALCAVACGAKTGAQDPNSNSSSSLYGMGNSQANGGSSSQAPVSSYTGEHVDIVGKVKLDMTSTTLKKTVTVKTFIDGDTTHFNMPDETYGSSVIKARYLGVNTPESTGKIEPWGKKASNFTHTTLENAKSIMIESDDENYNTDSTGGRCLLWVWYQPKEGGDYRNLNIELLQEGLAIASNSANNRYGDYCMQAINQAKAEKLRVYDPKGDPDFYVGGPIEVSLKELRAHMSSYDGTLVSFRGNVVRNYNNGVYVEEYQEDINQYCGMYVYYGFNTNANVMNALSIGNEVRVVGTVSSFNGTYQVSGLDYDPWEPEKNTFKTGEGKTGAYPLVSATDFTSDVSIDFEYVDEEGNESVNTETFKYSYLAVNTTIAMNNLKVNFITTTESETSSNGAMTFTCSSEGKSIKVRTEVLKDASGRTLVEKDFQNKTINVKGVVDYFNNAAQIKVFNYADITFVN